MVERQFVHRPCAAPAPFQPSLAPRTPSQDTLRRRAQKQPIVKVIHRAWPQRRVSARMRLILLRGVVRARENGAESRHRGGRRCGVAYGGALCVELP